ncbi:pirin family protein [Gracilimonas mengyeensis]|uniref:Pirin n=1 Tax=Gracilimonas mengyeensis TaxID=1302730 RepID=A0A521CF57_9BACT|nr:pirin family protein [Gracilimonas mengyeensis]SMO58015.1 Pirin [Gracilimonas mengyeensis]
MHHKDSDGNDLGIHSKHFMLMNAGSGIYHEEGVPEDEDTVEMLQIFIRPKADGLKPSIQFLEPKETSSLNTWRLLAGHERSQAPMIFRSEVLFYDALLEKGLNLVTPELNGKTGLLYVFHGSGSIGNSGVIVEKGDSIVIKDQLINIKSHDDADLVFFVLDENAPFSRNGLFAK